MWLGSGSIETFMRPFDVAVWGLKTKVEKR